jgi:hypothetical protein
VARTNVGWEDPRNEPRRLWLLLLEEGKISGLAPEQAQGVFANVLDSMMYLPPLSWMNARSPGASRRKSTVNVLTREFVDKLREARSLEIKGPDRRNGVKIEATNFRVRTLACPR